MDDKTKKDFTKILEEIFDRKFEQKFIPLFNQGFEEVVIPAIERSEEGLKKEIKKFRTEVTGRMDSFDRKMDRVIDKQIDYDFELKSLGKRVKKLESKSLIN